MVIGVSGANYYAPTGQAAFLTRDHDLFLPPDSDNLLRAWMACTDCGMELWLSDEPLDTPRDRWLAERIVERAALTRATGRDDLLVDLTLMMKGYDFETVWNERREFVIDGVGSLAKFFSKASRSFCDSAPGFSLRLDALFDEQPLARRTRRRCQ